MTKTDQPAAEAAEPKTEAKAYSTLAALVRAEKTRLNEPGFRAYAVHNGKPTPTYVATSSPARAALAVVEVERVATKDLLAAALTALAEPAGT